MVPKNGAAVVPGKERVPKNGAVFCTQIWGPKLVQKTPRDPPKRTFRLCISGGTAERVGMIRKRTFHRLRKVIAQSFLFAGKPSFRTKAA